MKETKKYYIPYFGKIKMMNLDKYYLHATDGIYGKHFERKRMINILEEKEIKTRNKRGQNAKVYNHDDELCLWDPKIKFYGIKKLLFSSAINTFIIEGPCFVLSRNINTFKPETIPFFQARRCPTAIVGKTDMYDEVRHQGDISLDHLEFITFPIEKPKKMRIYRDELLIYQKEISLIKRDFPDIKIKDIFTGNDLTEESIDNKINELEIKQLQRMALHSLFRR